MTNVVAIVKKVGVAIAAAANCSLPSLESIQVDASIGETLKRELAIIGNEKSNNFLMLARVDVVLVVQIA